MIDDFAAWLADNPEPDIADLIRQHGSYGAIPAEAWREFDRRMAAWQRLRRERYGGAVSSQTAKAFQKLRDDVARRAARIRRQSR